MLILGILPQLRVFMFTVLKLNIKLRRSWVHPILSQKIFKSKQLIWCSLSSVEISELDGSLFTSWIKSGKVGCSSRSTPTFLLIHLILDLTRTFGMGIFTSQIIFSLLFGFYFLVACKLWNWISLPSSLTSSAAGSA